MAKIPSPKPFGIAHDAWSREGSKCKNSPQFLDNYDNIFKDRKKTAGHVTIVYKNGKRYELPNPSTHGKEAEQAWEDFNRETGGLTFHRLKAIYE
jgi:hypothetical protein